MTRFIRRVIITAECGGVKILRFSVFQCTDTSAEQEKGYNCIIYTGLLFIRLMLSNALMYTTDYNRIAWCSISAIWAPTDWKCSTWVYILWGWYKYNLSFAARFYDTNNNMVNVMDRS